MKKIINSILTATLIAMSIAGCTTGNSLNDREPEVTEEVIESIAVRHEAISEHTDPHSEEPNLDPRHSRFEEHYNESESEEEEATDNDAETEAAVCAYFAQLLKPEKMPVPRKL